VGVDVHGFEGVVGEHGKRVAARVLREVAILIRAEVREDAGAVDAGNASEPTKNDAYYQDGFTTLLADAWFPLVTCHTGERCDTVVEAQVSALADDPFALALEIDVRLDGSTEKRPRGAFSMTLELFDAP
jgi:hypothetical protein